MGAAGTSNPRVPLPPIVGVPTPWQVSTDIKVVGVNLLIALILALLLALPAELLNATVRENYDEVTGWLRLNRGRLSRLHTVAAEMPTHGAFIFFICVGALLYGLLDPAFGLNLTTAAEILGLLGALLIVTLVHDVVRAQYINRRFKKRSRLTTFPAGIIFAIGLVLVSRMFHFQPGFIFGIMTGLAFSNELTDREDGHALAVAALLVLAVSFGAWFGWVPIKEAVASSSNPSFAMLTLDTLLATVWVAGIQSIIFAFIPLQFMDGQKVVSWSRAGWAAIYLLSMFVFVHTVLHPTSAQFGTTSGASVLALAALLIAMTALSVGLWSYFRFRSPRPETAEAPSAG
jgi:hypothetical protein